MERMTRTRALEELWQRCRYENLCMRVYRLDPVANGVRDLFVVAVSPRGFESRAIQVKTTNLESAAQLILDKYPDRFGDA